MKKERNLRDNQEKEKQEPGYDCLALFNRGLDETSYLLEKITVLE